MPEINYGPHMTTKDAPVITKLGVVSANGEMTPVVYKDRLCLIRTASVRPGCQCAQFYDCADQKILSSFGEGLEFFSGYEENGTLFAFGTYKGEKDGKCDHISMFRSEDGLNWSETVLFERPEFRFWNTSVCKGPNGYRMAIEISLASKLGDVLKHEPDELVGVPFTEFFLESTDLIHWNWLPDDHCYSKDRYTACPALRYCSDGYFYMICLEALPLVRYEPYIYRTKDFYTWEIGLHNPVLWVSREDRFPKPGVVFDEETLSKIRHYLNINDCDVDLCEFKGQTHLFYMTGDQLSLGFMCEAVYEGPMEEFLKSFFE